MTIERKSGKSRLVYDKTKRTIVTEGKSTMKIEEALDEIIECREALRRRRSQFPVIEEALKEQDQRGTNSLMDLFALGLWAVLRFTRS